MEKKDEKKLTLNEQAQEILRIAEKNGVEQNFLFVTTFKTYQVQLGILVELEKKIKEEGTIVQKEYVKGRCNVYTHPAVKEYNNTSNAANRTVATLIKIITTLRDKDGQEEDELLAFLKGGK